MKKNLLLIKELYSSKHELLIRKKLYSSRHKLSIWNELKRIYNILLFSYIKACILKKTDSFLLSFSGKYIQNRKQRVSDWFHYCVEKCYKIPYKMFYTILYKVYETFKPNNEKIALIKYKITKPTNIHKPIHCKVSNCPNELILEHILTKHGFKIVAEHLYITATEYEISAINDIKNK